MATINNVNNGDTGLAARDKINSNDNALNAELANKLTILPDITLADEATTFNNPTGDVQVTVNIRITGGGTHNIEPLNLVSEHTYYKFFVTKLGTEDLTLTIKIPFKTTFYLNDIVLKGSNGSRHLVEVFGYGSNSNLLVRLTKENTVVNRFKNLLDTFDFVGNALKFARVDSSETALEPVDISSLFVNLTGNQTISGIKKFSEELTANGLFKQGVAIRTATSPSSLIDFNLATPILRIKGTAELTIESIGAGTVVNSEHRIIKIVNTSTANVVVLNNSANGVSFNRFYIGSDLTITPGNSASFVYVSDTDLQNGWRLLSTSSQSGTSYTDQQARDAQALQQATGTLISFDRPKSYGYPTALTGTINFTFDFANAINGTAQVIRVNSATKPTLPASAKLLVDGFAASVDVYYYMTAILVDPATPTWEVHVTSSVAI